MAERDRYLWLLPEDAVEDFSARLGGRRLLSSAEQARMAALRTDGARRRYLGARVLSRYALSDRTSRPLELWRFRRNEYGRPEVLPPVDRVRFNLSHTDGMIACVVTHGADCGVDVERSPARPDAVAHLPRFFAPAERDVLAAQPGVRASQVAAYWVLKEAYLKALGIGIRRELSGFTLSPPAAGPIRVQDPQQDPERNAAWQFDLIYPYPGFVLAVATGGGGPGGLHRVDLSG
jgi:4'-phosphopantetheinyl transferase